MYKTSTDAYQHAAKIMSHEYANKYADYWTKKNKVIKTGKANFKDAGRQKTYNAEFAAIAEYKNKYPNDVKFNRLNWKQTNDISRRLQSLRPIRHCVQKQMRHGWVTNNRHLNLHTFVDALLDRQLDTDICVFKRLTVLTQSFMSLHTCVVICTMISDFAVT